MYKILKIIGVICTLLLFTAHFQYLQAQNGDLRLNGNFQNCTDTKAFKVKITNESTPGLFTSFHIDWGDGQSENLTALSGSHEYSSVGRYTLTFTGTKAGGGQETVTYEVVNDYATPKLGLTAGGEGGLCVGSEISFIISELQSNSSLTSYHLDFGDGNFKDFLGKDYAGQAQVEFKHRYNQSSCEYESGSTIRGMTITVTATNACGEQFNTSAGPYKVVAPVTLSFALPQKECTENPLDFAAMTGYLPHDCMEVQVQWDVVGKETDVAVPYTFMTPGDYEVRAYGQRNKLSCSLGEMTRPIKIIRRVKAILTPLQGEICEGATLQLDGSASVGDEKKYTWTVISGDAAQVEFTPAAAGDKNTVCFKKYGQYVIRMKVGNDCSSDYADVEIVVKKDPEIKAFRPLPSLCPNKTLQLGNYISYDWTWAENPRKPEWSITGPAGGYEYYVGNKNSEAPTLKFTKPGTYTLKVKLTGVGCGDGTKLEAFQTIVIYDPDITGTIVQGDADICEGESVIFTDNTQGVNLQTDWSVRLSTGGEATGVTITKNTDKTTTIQFDHYGDYKITADQTAECSGDTKSFDVKVRRAPEIYLTDFPQPFCPNKQFYPGEYIRFLPNGNDNVAFHWEVTGPHPVTIAGENTRTPKIDFTEWGDYTIKVTLTNPTTCGPQPSLTSSKVLHISNPEQNLNIIPDRSTICIGETVKFQNTSVVGVEPSYYWVVNPAGGVFEPGSGVTAKAPVIRFSESGIFNVTAAVTGVCKTETLPFTIIVQEDPEVVLDPIPAMCPGILQLSDALVHYTWNDDWKSGAEDLRIVKWKLTASPDGADCTPPESPEWDKQYPQLKLLTPGNYTLQAELKAFSGCHGTKLIASRQVVVYDPDLHIDVKPRISPEVVALGGNKYQAVEREPVQFVNNSTGVGLKAHWTVTPAENAVISDADADAPDITFRKYGTYNVRVDLTGTCKSDFREFVIVVKGVPAFRFDPIANRCDNWGEIDMRDYLTCDSAGSTEIICNWEILPATGFDLTGGALSDLFFKVKFIHPGVYTLRLNARAEYGGVQTVVRTVNVLNSVVRPEALLSRREGCTNDGLQVVADNKSMGDSLTYVWRVEPEINRTYTATPERLTADITGQGNYKIYLKAENICDSREEEYDIRAYSLPEVDVIGPVNLGEECEKGYLFRGTEHVGEIRTNNDPLNYIHWTVTPDGYSWENGSAESERPDLSFRGEKSYTIKGQFKNNCKDTVTVIYTVKIDEFVPVTLMSDTTVCAMTEPFLLRAEPTGGSWTVDPEGFLTEKGGKSYYFNPKVDEYRVFDLKYERGNGTCLASSQMKVSVNKLPVIDAGEDAEICLNDDPRPLVGIKPVVGEWRGNAVRENTFHPEESGEGTFRLEYWYTDASTGCPNLDTINMTVYGLPNPAFVTEPKHCAQAEALFTPVELGVGNHFFWTFGDGSAETETVDAAATHVFENPGNINVSMIAVSGHGCRDVAQASTPVVILALPPMADFSVDKEEGCGPLDVNITVDQTQYADTNLRFSWIFGNGSTASTLMPSENPLRFMPMVEDTLYSIEFTVFNKCKAEKINKEITVYSLPKAGFKMMNKFECSPVNVPFVNTSTGTGNTYRWLFGDGQATSDKNPDHDYYAGDKAKDYIIQLYAENRCAVDSISDTLTVKPNSIRALFSMSARRICAGEEVCLTNYSSDTSATFINQYWEFGDGMTDTLWDVCHTYKQAGTYPINLYLDNGCGFANRQDSVIVYAIPELKIESEDQLCEGAAFHFSLESSERLKSVVWNMGDDSIVRAQNPFSYIYAGSGIFEVTVNVRSATSTACPAEISRKIEVWSNPVVNIIPLDTVACSPFLYQPEITGDGYFKWDYGVGEGLSSEDHYLYTNDTNFIQDYDIMAYVETNRGCKGEYRGHIKIYNSPKVSFDEEISYGRPEKVLFVNHSRDYTDCIWYLPDGSVIYSPDNQEVIFEQKGTYPVSLVGVNEYGCRDSVCIEHIAYMGGLYFPNTFIPHSTNEKVNNFRGIGMGLKEYHLEIFDLYGNKVWESKALEDGMPSEGWDGRNKNGELLPQGVYMWRAKAIFYSEDLWTGDNNPSGKKQSTQGTVLLLKK